MSRSLLEAWEQTVRDAPASPALIDAATGTTHSRMEIDRDADAWHEQHGAGLAGQTVVFAEPNGRNWLRLFLGLLKARAVVAALDAGEPPVSRRAIARGIGAAWLWENEALVPIAARPPARDGRRLVKLTSGSTGRPRALAFTDDQMLADGRNICAGMDIRTSDVNFGLIPFGHSYGLGNLVLPLLEQGTPIVCGVAALPHAMAEAIARWRPTVFPAVPALLHALVSSEVTAGQLESLRTVISAGAPLGAEVAAAFEARFARTVHGFYGSSETGGITYDRSGDATRTGRSVGAPLPGVTIEFERGGRFRVASAAVYTLGNRRRDASGQGVHRPADIGASVGEGELALTGRVGRFVKIAGRRLNLGEVERALKGIAGVRDAWVAAHHERPDALAAVVATDQNIATIRGALREQIAGWKVPKKIVTVAVFPVTARGKTDTAQLRALIEG